MPDRARGWPRAGQIGFAIVVGLIVALFVGTLTHHSTAKGTATSSPSTTSTRPIRTPVSDPPVPATGLVALTIAPASHQDTYSRETDFGGWTDSNGCRNTRAAILIRTSRVPVTFTTARGCTVATGDWIDPWSGATTRLARDFQIDHTVPLGNAWASGAWSWTHARRVAFTNDLTEADHLVAILAHENEQKSDDGPEQWRPPDRRAWCRYALDWDHIKATWHLTATAAEWSALREMSAPC